MKINKIIFFLHVFKGYGGDKLAYFYVTSLLKLLKSKQAVISIYVNCYGFLEDEESSIKSMFSDIDLCVEKVFFDFGSLVFSEVPTLHKAISLSKISDPNDLVVYIHSKGASYKDQTYFVNWAAYATATLAAALDHVLLQPDLIEKYDAFGSFAGLGVFERYGTLSPAFSGNFWLTTSKHLASRDFVKKWYSYAYHNRHYAEALLGIRVQPSRFLNLEDNYHLRASTRPDPENIYEKIKGELAALSAADQASLTFVNSYIESYYKHLVDQQRTYSERRLFWRLRRLMFGNGSILRYFSFVSKGIDILFPWRQSELYRHYSGPKQFDVLNNFFATQHQNNLKGGIR